MHKATPNLCLQVLICTPQVFTSTCVTWAKTKKSKTGRGAGEVVSLLAFYSIDPSLNPAEAQSFFSEFVFEKNKRGRGWPI